MNKYEKMNNIVKRKNGNGVNDLLEVYSHSMFSYFFHL